MAAIVHGQSGLETRTGRRSWEQRFEALVRYRDQHGDCNVPSYYPPDSGLRDFVSHIRSGKIEVTGDQRTRLGALGFNWETRSQKLERVWQNMFARYKETRSTLTKKNNVKLYNWVITQRRFKSKGRLSLHREQKLSSIGFDWQTVQSCNKYIAVNDKLDKRWVANYHKLVDFYHENNHSLVPWQYKDKSLGHWVKDQRTNRKYQELNDEQIRLLNDLQFVWKCDNNDASASLTQKHWDTMLGLVEDYKDTYGNIMKIPEKTRHQERPIGIWLALQQRLARSGKLYPLRALRLQSIGVELNYSVEPWDQYYRLVETFQKEHGHCKLPEDQSHYRGLIWWLKLQEELHTKGELCAERKALLERLGVKWGHPARSRATADVTRALDVKGATRAVKTALKNAPQRSAKAKHLRRHLREILGCARGSKKRDLDKLLDRVVQSHARMVKCGKVITLRKHKMTP